MKIQIRYAVLLCLLAMMVGLQVVAAQAEAAPSPTKKKNISEHPSPPTAQCGHACAGWLAGPALVVCTAWVKHTRWLSER